MLRKILFFIFIAFVISGCSYKETVKKADEIQGIFMHNGGYYVFGKKFSYKLNETSRIDEIKEFYKSDFSKKIVKDLAKVNIDEESAKMDGQYIVALDYNAFTDSERNRLYSTFKVFNEKNTLNIEIDTEYKKVLYAGFHLSGDVIKISNDEKNRILSLGKFKNPINVKIDYVALKETSAREGVEAVGGLVFAPFALILPVAAIATFPIWIPLVCIFHRCN